MKTKEVYFYSNKLFTGVFTAMKCLHVQSISTQLCKNTEFRKDILTLLLLYLFILRIIMNFYNQKG